MSRTKAEPNEAGRRLQSREERDGVARHRLARARAGFRGVGERVRDGGMRVVARGEVAAVSTRSGRKWPSVLFSLDLTSRDPRHPSPRVAFRPSPGLRFFLHFFCMSVMWK